jgi:hypothetical protein
VRACLSLTVNPAGRGSGRLQGETPNELSAGEASQKPQDSVKGKKCKASSYIAPRPGKLQMGCGITNLERRKTWRAKILRRFRPGLAELRVFEGSCRKFLVFVFNGVQDGCIQIEIGPCGRIGRRRWFGMDACPTRNERSGHWCKSKIGEYRLFEANWKRS